MKKLVFNILIINIFFIEIIFGYIKEEPRNLLEILTIESEIAACSLTGFGFKDKCDIFYNSQGKMITSDSFALDINRVNEESYRKHLLVSHKLLHTKSPSTYVEYIMHGFFDYFLPRLVLYHKAKHENSEQIRIQVSANGAQNSISISPEVLDQQADFIFFHVLGLTSNGIFDKLKQYGRYVPRHELIAFVDLIYESINKLLDGPSSLVDDLARLETLDLIFDDLTFYVFGEDAKSVLSQASMNPSWEGLQERIVTRIQSIRTIETETKPAIASLEAKEISEEIIQDFIELGWRDPDILQHINFYYVNEIVMNTRKPGDSCSKEICEKFPDWYSYYRKQLVPPNVRIANTMSPHKSSRNSVQAILTPSNLSDFGIEKPFYEVTIDDLDTAGLLKSRKTYLRLNGGYSSQKFVVTGKSSKKIQLTSSEILKSRFDRIVRSPRKWGIDNIEIPRSFKFFKDKFSDGKNKGKFFAAIVCEKRLRERSDFYYIPISVYVQSSHVDAFLARIDVKPGFSELAHAWHRSFPDAIEKARSYSKLKKLFVYIFSKKIRPTSMVTLTITDPYLSLAQPEIQAMIASKLFEPENLRKIKYNEYEINPS